MSSEWPYKAIIPDHVWHSKDEARSYRVRIVDHRSDGRIVIERIGPEFERFGFRKEITVTEYQLRAAYEPSGDWDFGLRNLVPDISEDDLGDLPF